LALTQSRWVAAQLAEHGDAEVEICVISTRGDRVQDRPLAEVGGKGLFTEELEAGLRNGEIDLAVHSLKDLPTDDPPGIELGCVPVRADPHDVLVGPELDALSPGARVGTGSLRRATQLRVLRPDLDIVDIRGNVPTRIAKLDAGDFDAIILAKAGLDRLGIERPDIHIFSVDQMIPAVGQGALGVQCREGDDQVRDVLDAISDLGTWRCVEAERAFLEAIGGGCNVAAGCLALLSRGKVQLMAMGINAQGKVVKCGGVGPDGPGLGRQVAGRITS
jgi:hydroxymethylbilane synthase